MGLMVCVGDWRGFGGFVGMILEVFLGVGRDDLGGWLDGWRSEWW